MFTVTLTRQQPYELYYEGPGAIIRLIESLLEELADFERILGQRRQWVDDSRRERNRRQAAQLKRVKEGLWRQERQNLQLVLSPPEAGEAEPERRERLAEEPRCDSHSSSLLPARSRPSSGGGSSSCRPCG